MEYRKPDPWALRHRRVIQWTAGVVVAGSFIGFWQLSEVWDRLLILIFVADLLLWGWLSEKYRPGGGDWWDFLLIKASEDPVFLEQLEQIDQDFRELWNLDQSASIREMLEEDLVC